ncbi:MAG: DUF192 domain-containing protein [Acidobacteria bacterium]|nr:DUF192 domain-containing protein [Acidobacteriota bacterium]
MVNTKSTGKKEIKATATLPNGHIYNLEIAKTPLERARGLMFRENLPPEQGMIFIFEEKDFHTFHMKNTLIPLDMLWLDDNFKLVYFVLDAQPCKTKDCESIIPFAKANYVIEFNSGVVKKEELKIGMKIKIEFLY